jgi:hypothetical protein
MEKDEISNIEEKINELTTKMVSIESKISQIDKSKQFDYEKVISTIKYLYKYYDDMNKDKRIDITSTQQ